MKFRKLSTIEIALVVLEGTATILDFLHQRNYRALDRIRELKRRLQSRLTTKRDNVNRESDLQRLDPVAWWRANRPKVHTEPLSTYPPHIRNESAWSWDPTRYDFWVPRRFVTDSGPTACSAKQHLSYKDGAPYLNGRRLADYLSVLQKVPTRQLTTQYATPVDLTREIEDQRKIREEFERLYPKAETQPISANEEHIREETPQKIPDNIDVNEVTTEELQSLWRHDPDVSAAFSAHILKRL